MPPVRDTGDDLLLAVSILLVGLIPVILAIAQSVPFGPQPTIGLIFAALGSAGVVHELRRRRRERNRPQI